MGLVNSYRCVFRPCNITVLELRPNITLFEFQGLASFKLGRFYVVVES